MNFILTKHSTFREQDELLRGQANMLPQGFYRTFYETSATLSKYVSIDTHVKHRKRKTLVIQDGMAFQPVARFTVHDYLHREGIERHLVWNQKKDPSGYVSVFNDLCESNSTDGCSCLLTSVEHMQRDEQAFIMTRASVLANVSASPASTQTD